MHQLLSSAEPVGLRNNRLFSTGDIDVARECIAKVLQPHELMPSRGWRTGDCFLDQVVVGDTGVGAIRFGAARVSVPAIADYYLFLATRKGSASIAIDDKEHLIDQSHGIIIAPGEQMIGRFSEDCEQFFVRMDQRAVEAHAGLRNIRFSRGVSLADGRLQPWFSLLNSLSCDPQVGKLVNNHGSLAKDYERLLVGLLLAGQEHEAPSRRVAGAAPGCVKRAEDFIHAAFTDPISLSDIAEAARVPSRTLLESFRRFRETSPMRYLRDVRLDHARDLMIKGEVQSTALAAMGACLMHFGRFSKDYADRFGELPSETLRRRGCATG